MRKLLISLTLIVSSLSGAMASPVVLDMQDTTGTIHQVGNGLVLTTPTTYSNAPVDVIYLNSQANTTLYPAIGITGMSVLIYITRNALAGHALTIDCSGEDKPISLNGVILGNTVTLYPGDRPKLYKLVSSEDGDHYDIFEIGRSGRSQTAAPTTGQTISALEDVTLLAIKPAQTLAALSISLPPHAQDGDSFSFFSTQAINSLSILAGANSVAGGYSGVAFAANSTATFKYSIIDQTWYRVI